MKYNTFELAFYVLGTAKFHVKKKKKKIKSVKFTKSISCHD